MAVFSFKLVILVAVFIGQTTVSHSNYCGFPSECASPKSKAHAPNWKQCVWKSANDGRDNGEVHECLFYKQRADSYLRVAYQGNIRVFCGNGCCKRWFFTFNKVECSTPAPIDAVVYQHLTPAGPSANIHRSATQEGYCGGIGKGIVRVGFSVGNCAGHGDADAYTSWNSVSRIVIEEVDPPQA
ncbi:collagen triple helix repeat-containing protein 1-like isoform X2 [Actinia tenebrosa]|uniref:Collagen triple helix repeat-containing protein 1-like isoform X2 n=1 Tax=Actinia tenebrosa TaxID=6105 RepID=A0A6P8IDK2_ACTTE|nr:collagen triple helix repeat-containing protein 1-like isoform X2 [Actinia tenebrosa]